MSRYKFSTSKAISEEMALRLKTTIPGAWVRGSHQIDAHSNCAWLVERFLKEQSFSYDTKTLPLRFSTSVIPEELRPGVPDRIFGFQRRIAEYGSHREGITVWAPTGCGKTLSAIILALQTSGKVVWVTRKISREGHTQEIESWSHARAHEIKGVTPLDKRTDFNKDARFFVLGWETLPFHLDQLLELGPTTVVFDEIQKAKQPKRSDRLQDANDKIVYVGKRNLSDCASLLAKKCKRRIGLTATPLKNRVRDLWSQLDIIDPWAWGSRSTWMTRYAGRHETLFSRAVDDGATHIPELKQRLSLSVIRIPKSETHRDLPPLRRQLLRIPSTELVDVGQRRQAQALAGLGPLEGAFALSSIRKRKVVVEQVTQALAEDQKVVVFVGRRNDAPETAEAIKKKTDAPVMWCRGGMTNINAVVNEYISAKGAACLVATGDSIGEALDGLQCTQLVLMAFLPWTPGQIEQWEGRFQRQGMLTPVLIMYLIAEGNEADERVVTALLDKLPAVESVVGSSTVSEVRRTLLGGRSDAEIEADLMRQLGIAA